MDWCLAGHSQVCDVSGGSVAAARPANLFIPPEAYLYEKWYQFAILMIPSKTSVYNVQDPKSKCDAHIPSPYTELLRMIIIPSNPNVEINIEKKRKEKSIPSIANFQALHRRLIAIFIVIDTILVSPTAVGLFLILRRPSTSLGIGISSRPRGAIARCRCRRWRMRRRRLCR